MSLSHRIFLCLMLFFAAVFLNLNAQEPPFLQYLQDDWVNSQLDNMTLEEKIAQLMMISIYPELDTDRRDKALMAVNQWQPGGILVMQGAPTKTVILINEFQSHSKIPLLVAIDGEWGPAMRIDSVLKFPYNQAIGAVQDSVYVYKMGYDTGTQLKHLGIHINFAPVADVNTNPENPVINFRSFGEDKNEVAQKAYLLVKGMQDAGIAAVAKHFPGHGDTESDSHKTLPYLKHSKQRMDSLESFPFRYLSARGVSGIMSAHLNVPSLDEMGNPSSLSDKIINGYLKDEIGFHGIVVTDALNMKGVSDHENVTLKAIKAGNDLAEFVPDIEKAVLSIKKAVEDGYIASSEIDEKCRKILALKRWVQLNNYKPVSLDGLHSRLNSPYHEVTARKLIKGSFTVLKNDNILPVENLENLKIASVLIGGNEISAFQQMLSSYADIDHYYLPKNASEKTWLELRKKLDNYTLVIAGITGVNIYPSNKYGTSEIQRKAVAEIVQDNNAVFVFFGNAYALKHFDNVQHANGLIVAYENNHLTQELAAQLVFGAIGATGKLPVTIDERFKLNDGIVLKKNDCLSFTLPEELNIKSNLLGIKIDSLANLGIDSSAYPGCQVLISKNGSVIFHKCYGYHTYKKRQKVEKNNIYDWASITKVTGPLPAIMKLVDDNKMNLNMPLSYYWPDFKNTDKEKLTLREILTHQSRLMAWIPYWQMTLTDKGELDRRIFKKHPTKTFDMRVSENLYMNKFFKQSIYDTIKNSKLNPRKRYLYSGLSFYLYPQIISELTGINYEDYLKQTFLKPLGANSVTYNAHQHFPVKSIVPTEKDDFFRNEQLQGFVHDEGAAMMGGVSGNAGLFGATIDLAKIFQMYLQKGFYGGKRYISEKTVNEFIRIQYPENKNRRGLGFDKPLIDNHKNRLRDAYPAVDASPNSFGHSGFTGTFAWADPDNGLLFIFMSNRVFPTRENQKLYELNIRTAMHQAIYDCIKTGLK